MEKQSPKMVEKIILESELESKKGYLNACVQMKQSSSSEVNFKIYSEKISAVGGEIMELERKIKKLQEELEYE
jgi:hypothetical protein